MARPKLDIEPSSIQKLAERGLTNKEIAEFHNCSTDTLERRYAADLRKGRVNLKMSLRTKQIQLALNGNVTLLIWLGKQILGQVERSQIDLAKVPDDIFLAEAQRRLEDGSKTTKDS